MNCRSTDLKKTIKRPAEPPTPTISRKGNRELDLGGLAYQFRRCGTVASGTKPTTVPISATLCR